MISDDFEVAAGSVIGRDHLRPFGWRNNQDSYAIQSSSDFIVAVVTDGCGSEAKSEVGAVLGARLVAEAVTRELHELYLGLGRHLDLDRDIPIGLLSGFWSTVRWRVLDTIERLAMNMGPRMRETIFDHFLFTVNGVALTSHRATFFAIGDGVTFLNGVQIPHPTFENNAPAYLTYTALKGPGDLDPANDFRITKVIPTEEVETILIGTDGVLHLIAAEEATLPGRSEIVGCVSQFWTEDKYFKNPDMLRRRLALMNAEDVRPNWDERTIARDHGRLPDDTTIIAIRRKSSA